MTVSNRFDVKMIDAIEQKKLRERFNPEGSLLRQHQLRMLDMLKYIDAVCRKNNIKYWLCSGTLIGAVRHGGFIPWDDDVDIEMLKEDYKKLVKVMKNEPQDDYVLQTHETDSNYYYPFAKLRDLHSCIKENHESDRYYKYKGCFIDIFIMEPSSSLFLHKLSVKIQAGLVFRPNLIIKNRIFRNIYFPVVLFLINNLLFPLLGFISGLAARGQLRHTLGTKFFKARNMEDIFPLATTRFEDTTFFVPYNSDSYLRKIYGEYTCLPNLDKIKIHTCNIELYS